MQATHHERSGPVAAFGATGAVFSALSVGLAAYASHGAEGDARARLMLAAVFAFGHGVALAALAPTGGTLLIAGWLLFALHCLKR